MLLPDAVVWVAIWLAAVFNIHEEQWRKSLPCLFSVRLLKAYMEHLYVLWFLNAVGFYYYEMVQIFMTASDNAERGFAFSW